MKGGVLMGRLLIFGMGICIAILAGMFFMSEPADDSFVMDKTKDGALVSGLNTQKTYDYKQILIPSREFDSAVGVASSSDMSIMVTENKYVLESESKDAVDLHEEKKAITLSEEKETGNYCGEIYWSECPLGEVFYCPPDGNAYCHDNAEVFCNGAFWAPCAEGAVFSCVKNSDPVCEITQEPIENKIIDIATSSLLECNGKYWTSCSEDMFFYCPEEGDALCTDVDYTQVTLVDAQEISEEELEGLKLATVRIVCELDNGGEGSGSGFVIDSHGTIVTNAHVVDGAVTDECTIVFPLKNLNGVYAAVHYLKGEIIDRETILERYYTEGVDVAYLKLLPNDNSRDFFGSEYPKAVAFPLCEGVNLNDEIIHLGYASNYSTSIYSKGDILTYGEARVQYFGDIARVINNFGGKEYHYSYSNIPRKQVVISVGKESKIYFGSSGGLAFNKHKQCIVGLNTSIWTNPDTNDIHTHIFDLGFSDF